jgi:peptidoglycan hydrolase-like protein with peptidoglycan-binding domain
VLCTGPAADGVVGPQTRAAIKEFQRRRDLVADVAWTGAVEPTLVAEGAFRCSSLQRTEANLAASRAARGVHAGPRLARSNASRQPLPGPRAVDHRVPLIRIPQGVLSELCEPDPSDKSLARRGGADDSRHVMRGWRGRGARDR